MLGSRSDFFKKDKETIEKGRDFMNLYLLEHGTVDSVVAIYNEAFDYFIENPSDFDGATILKDMKMVPNLDMWAMIHDYFYIKFKVSANWYYKTYADLIYAKEMERLGITWEVSWVRFSLLVITHVVFTPYVRLVKGYSMSKDDKSEFKRIMNAFNKSSELF